MKRNNNTSLDYKNDRIDVFSFGVIMSDVLFDDYPMVKKKYKYKYNKIKFIKFLGNEKRLIRKNIM